MPASIDTEAGYLVSIFSVCWSLVEFNAGNELCPSLQQLGLLAGLGYYKLETGYTEI